MHSEGNVALDLFDAIPDSFSDSEVQEAELLEDIPAVIDIPVKKKRGRPAKVKVDVLDPDTLKETPAKTETIKKRRGRPPKNPDAIKEEKKIKTSRVKKTMEISEDIIPPIVKKRGRPKKSPEEKAAKSKDIVQMIFDDYSTMPIEKLSKKVGLDTTTISNIMTILKQDFTDALEHCDFTKESFNEQILPKFIGYNTASLDKEIKNVVSSTIKKFKS